MRVKVRATLLGAAFVGITLCLLILISMISPQDDTGHKGTQASEVSKSVREVTPFPTHAPVVPHHVVDPEDKFEDLAAALFEVEPQAKLQEKYYERNPTLFEVIKHKKPRRNASLWERFHAGITQNELYPVDSPVVDPLLKEMATRPIVSLEQKEGGTQLKLVIHFDNGGEALVKFMRFPREVETDPNHFYFSDYERHNSEIASFHLDRILGFRQAPPTVGRLFNITSEIYPLAKKDFLRTFFVSPANNLCFHGKCSYYCDTGHAICGRPDTVEGSVAVMLPSKDVAPRRSWRSPWRRSYNKRRRAEWEIEPEGYCDRIKSTTPYDNPRLLLNLIDLTLYDFLTGNMDRHHYETFDSFGNMSKPLRLDQGRGFGKSRHDELSILAPLYQCCVIRRSTLEMLLGFHNPRPGRPKLSEAMRASLDHDPVRPVLLEPHLLALDRRVALILSTVRTCIKTHGVKSVLLHDPPLHHS